jgi:Flp pilus assembly pilin Flp
MLDFIRSPAGTTATEFGLILSLIMVPLLTLVYQIGYNEVTVINILNNALSV